MASKGRVRPGGTGHGLVVAGRYRTEALLGRGGSGSVYRARDLLAGCPVALKVLDGMASPSEARRFDVEARLLARLEHPNLVRLLGAGEDKGLRFLVMHLVEGPNLAQVLGDGPLSPARVATVGTGMASALAYIHNRGVVHRDVKPSNVLLSRSGEVFLADFGTARLAGAAGVTSTGVTIGTPAYLAPEQALATGVGPGSDVYSLGLVLLECLTGRRPFDGTASEVIAARLRGCPPMPERLPSQWRELLEAMTQVEPGGRPGADEVAERLAALAEPATVAVVAPTWAPPDPVISGRVPAGPVVSAPRSATSRRIERKRHPLHLAVSSAGVVAAVLALFELVPAASRLGQGGATSPGPTVAAGAPRPGATTGPSAGASAWAPSVTGLDASERYLPARPGTGAGAGTRLSRAARGQVGQGRGGAAGRTASVRTRGRSHHAGSTASAAAAAIALAPTASGSTSSSRPGTKRGGRAVVRHPASGRTSEPGHTSEPTAGNRTRSEAGGAGSLRRGNGSATGRSTPASGTRASGARAGSTRGSGNGASPRTGESRSQRRRGRGAGSGGPTTQTTAGSPVTVRVARGAPVKQTTTAAGTSTTPGVVVGSSRPAGPGALPSPATTSTVPQDPPTTALPGGQGPGVPPGEAAATTTTAAETSVPRGRGEGRGKHHAPTTTTSRSERTGTSVSSSSVPHTGHPTSTTVPASTVPGSTVPGSTVPGSTVPGSTVPGSTVPGSTVPGSTVPGSTVPGSAGPASGGEPPGATTVPARTTTSAPAPRDKKPGSSTTAVPSNTSPAASTTTAPAAPGSGDAPKKPSGPHHGKDKRKPHRKDGSGVLGYAPQ